MPYGSQKRNMRIQVFILNSPSTGFKNTPFSMGHNIWIWFLRLVISNRGTDSLHFVDIYS